MMQNSPQQEPSAQKDIDSELTGDGDDTPSEPPTIGYHIDVHWPIDDNFYSVTVTNVDDQGSHEFQYNDGHQETPQMDEETWRFSNTVKSNSSSMTTQNLGSSKQECLRSLFDKFGKKSFKLHRTQGFEQFPLYNAYRSEQESFLKKFRMIPSEQLPINVNIINSHVIYKVKINDDQTLKLKARIYKHVNEDEIKGELKKDGCICPPTGVRILSFFCYNNQMVCLKNQKLM